MRTSLAAVLLLAGLFGAGCSHRLEITNLDEYYSPPPPLIQRQTMGVMSLNSPDPQNGRYVSAIVDALQRSGNLDRIIYPYSQANHQDITHTVVSIGVEPKYSGSRMNFLINFPGFLIFAPAIWGYEYHADIDTRVNINSLKGGVPIHLVVPTSYTFRQAEIDRTWTEVGWLEWGIIPLFGGLVFMDYDPDVTNQFIAAVSANYGAFVAGKILQAVGEVPPPAPVEPAVAAPPAPEAQQPGEAQQPSN
jgi:hypothetical protein